MNLIRVKEIIRKALNEDIGAEDLTTEALVPVDHRSSAVLLAKQPGVIAGLPVVDLVFKELDPACQLTRLKPEGAEVTKGTIVARITGPTRAILTGERVALNSVTTDVRDCHDHS